MNGILSKKAVIFLCLFALVAAGAVGWSSYQNSRFNHTARLFVLQLKADKDFASDAPTALESLDKYQQALEHDERPEAGISAYQEVIFVHAKKACIYKKNGDEAKYLEERNAVKEMMLDNPDETKAVNAADVDKAVDAMLKGAEDLLNRNKAASPPASPKP